MRVTTAFNRLLALQGARVIDVLFGAEGVTVRVALCRRRAVCSSCGQVCRRIHDRAWRRWRHLDLGGQRCFIEYELRRVRCADCGVRVEALAWARAGARHTRDFEDLVAFMAQQMAKTPISRLLGIGWDTVGAIVQRVVGDHLDADRLAGLVTIPPRPAIPDPGLRPRHGRDRVGQARPQRPDVAGLLRRARRPQGVDPGRLDRHERRL
ncbi:MAG: transposase family protein [Actinomycetota bacterium]|nr:transposase family protein [Actinomycetota bacterium]